MGVRERKEREREQRRQDILASARQAFEKYGIQHASMDKIAEEAELAKGTLYLYYKNRDELLMALIAEDLVGLIERLEKVTTSKDAPDKKLVKAVSTFHTYSSENAFLYQVMTQMDMRHLMCPQDCGPSESVTQFTQLNDRMMQIMIGLIQEGVDKGLYQLEHPVQYVVLQLLFALKGTMVILRNGMVPPEWAKVDPGKILNDTVKLFIRGLKCPLPTSN